MYERCLESSTEVFYSMFGKPHTKPPPSEKTWEQGLRGGGSTTNPRPLSSAGDLAVPPLQKKVGDGEKTVSTCAPRVYNEWKERLEDTGMRMSSFMRRSRKEEGAAGICRDVLRANQGGLISAVTSANRHGRARPGTAQPGLRQEWGRGEWSGPSPTLSISNPEFSGAALSGLFIGRGSGAAIAVGQGLFRPAGEPSREMPVAGRFWSSSTSSVASLHGGFPMHLRPTSGGANRTSRQSIPQSVLISLRRRQQQYLQQRKAQSFPVGPEQSPDTAHQVSVMSGSAAWHPPESAGWQPRLVEHQHTHNRPTVGRHALTNSPPRRSLLGNDSSPILPSSFVSDEIGGGMKGAGEVEATSSLLFHSTQSPSKLRLTASKTITPPGASRALSLDMLLPPRTSTRGVYISCA